MSNDNMDINDELSARIWRESPEAIVRGVVGDADAVWRGIQSRTGLDIPSIKARRSYVRSWMGLAAAAAIVVGVFGVKYLPDVFDKTLDVPKIVTYSTDIGQRANVTLADGSKVILAPATVMKVMGKDGRSIELNGEALFTVTNHQGEPFVVTTGKYVTRVLGTAFGVRIYNNGVRVAVRDGKVSVGSVMLSSNDVVVIKNGNTSVYHNANVAALTAWTSGRIVFDDTPTSEVLSELRRWYDIDIQLAPGVPERHITASVEAGSLSEVLDFLTPALGVKYSRNGRVITLKP